MGELLYTRRNAETKPPLDDFVFVEQRIGLKLGSQAVEGRFSVVSFVELGDMKQPVPFVDHRKVGSAHNEPTQFGQHVPFLLAESDQR